MGIIDLSKSSQVIQLRDEADTNRLAAQIARQLKPGAIMYLQGNLGTGKTFFCKALIQQLGYNGKVLSPTYSLVQSYPIQLATAISIQVHHFDLYRLAAPEELEFIGIRDYINEKDICLIEWPEKGLGILPSPSIKLNLAYLNDRQNTQALDSLLQSEPDQNSLITGRVASLHIF